MDNNLLGQVESKEFHKPQRIYGRRLVLGRGDWYKKYGVGNGNSKQSWSEISTSNREFL